MGCSPGLVAVCHVRGADVGPGEWRIPAGELHRAFTKVEDIDVLDAREEEGEARLLGRKVVRRLESLAGPRRIRNFCHVLARTVWRTVFRLTR